MEPKNNTAYSSQPSGNPYGASLTGASPNSPNSNKYRNWCIWGGLIIALLIVLGACCYHIIARDGAPVVVTDSLSTRLLQDSLSNNKTRIVQLTPEFIKAIEQYDELSLYSEGYAAVRKGELWGYIDTWGREVIPCKYYGAHPFHEGLASVKLSYGDGWAFIDTLGQVVIPPPTDTNEMYLPGEFSEGRVVFMSYCQELFTVLDRQGNRVFRGTYYEHCEPYEGPEMSPFNHPAFVAKYIDGKLYIPREDSEYYRVYDTEGNRLKDVSREEKNKEREKIEGGANAGKGKTFIRPLLFDFDGMYGGALCLWGLKDSHGKVLIPDEYDHVGIYIYPNSMYSNSPIDLSNGVVPVALQEFKELTSDHIFWMNSGFLYSFLGKTYYGYADLKGNDTFPKGLKERCEKTRQRAIEEYLENEGVYGENNLVNGKDLTELTAPAEVEVVEARPSYSAESW